MKWISRLWLFCFIICPLDVCRFSNCAAIFGIQYAAWLFCYIFAANTRPCGAHRYGFGNGNLVRWVDWRATRTVLSNGYLKLRNLFVASIYSLALILGSIMAGSFIERFGRHPTITYPLLLTISGWILTGFATSTTPLLISRFLIGCSNSLVSTSAQVTWLTWLIHFENHSFIAIILILQTRSISRFTFPKYPIHHCVVPSWISATLCSPSVFWWRTCWAHCCIGAMWHGWALWCPWYH